MRHIDRSVGHENSSPPCRRRYRAAELAGFLDGADLPAELALEIAADLAAAQGLLDRAVRAIETAGPG